MPITIENHGPWNREPGDLTRLLKTNPLPDGLYPTGNYEVTYYLSHLPNGEQALAEFAQTLMARKRWTLLLSYGGTCPNWARLMATWASKITILRLTTCQAWCSMSPNCRKTAISQSHLLSASQRRANAARLGVRCGHKLDDADASPAILI